MRETSLSAKAALSCLLAVVRGYANTIMRYRARQVDIITRIVSPAHARECRRAAYYKDFPMGVIGAAAVAGEETSAAVFYKRGGTAVLLKRPAVAVITSGCLAACVSATSKKSLQVLPACDLLSCGTRARGNRHLQSLEAHPPPPSARTTLLHFRTSLRQTLAAADDPFPIFLPSFLQTTAKVLCPPHPSSPAVPPPTAVRGPLPMTAIPASHG